MKRKDGFTMAELLIVVAIISVLVAIAIPTFTAQLQKSRLETDVANVRSKFAEIVSDKLASGDIEDGKLQISKAELSDEAVLIYGSSITFADGDKITISRALCDPQEIPVDASIAFVD